MAQRTYSITLNSTYLPTHPSEVAGACIMLGSEVAYNRTLVPEAQQPYFLKLPQIQYVRDYLPTFEGMCSVYYHPLADTTGLSGFEIVSNVITLWGTTSAEYVKVVVVSDGTHAYLRRLMPGSVAWGAFGVLTESGEPTFDADAAPMITKARVQGQDYLYIEGYGCFVFSWGSSSQSFVRVTLDGLDETNIKGILAASGYLVAFTNIALAWSSTLDLLPSPSLRSTAYSLGDTVYHEGFTFECTTAGTTDSSEPDWLVDISDPPPITISDGTVDWERQDTLIDFIPSTLTGAGGGNVEEIDGFIVCGMEIAGGFILYSQNNAVSAQFTNNALYPFIFKSLNSCSGVADYRHVTGSDKPIGHYVYTTTGLQLVSTVNAKHDLVQWSAGLDVAMRGNTLPEVNVDLAAGYTVSSLTGTLQQLVFCGGRYLCARIQDTVYVYDVRLERAGVLADLDLVYDYKSSQEDDAPVQEGLGEIGGVRNSIQVVCIPRAYGSSADRFLMLGALKHVRGKDITLLKILISCTEPFPEDAPDVYVLSSYDGRSYTHVEHLQVGGAGFVHGHLEVECCVEAQHLAVVMKRGGMHITGVEFTYLVAGDSR